MAAPALSSALPPATYQYPLIVVELRNHANNISKKVIDLKSKRDLTPGQICAHALSITEAVESACAGRSLEVLEPFAAVALEEIVRLFSSCCTALDVASQKLSFGARLSALTSRAIPRSPSPSPSPMSAESTSLDDYRVSLEAVKALLRIENGQSQLVYSGTIAPLVVQSSALLQYARNATIHGTFELIHRPSEAMSKSTAFDEAFKTALQTMANITDGLPFPCKAVAQTVLQLHMHGETYRATDSSIATLIRKVDDFVEILAKPGAQNIVPGEDIARAVERFFRAVQSIIVRLEIVRATATIKKLVASTAVKTAVAEAQADLDDARRLLDMALQVDTNL